MADAVAIQKSMREWKKRNISGRCRNLESALINSRVFIVSAARQKVYIIIIIIILIIIHEARGGKQVFLHYVNVAKL